MLKKCSSCKELLDRSKFHVCVRWKDGLSYICKLCKKKISATWYEKNKEQMYQYRMANAERIRQMKKKWYENNKERHAERMIEWRKKNPYAAIVQLAHRRAAQHKATVSWRNKFFIREAYHLARLRTKLLGYKWHVDHIVPLKHKLVCGLHVEHNLRVIPASENWKKGNFSWPDMPT